MTENDKNGRSVQVRWGLVLEYLTDELAENGEDERRIHKAEKASEKKKKEIFKKESREREACN